MDHISSRLGLIAANWGVSRALADTRSVSQPMLNLPLAEERAHGAPARAAVLWQGRVQEARLSHSPSQQLPRAQSHFPDDPYTLEQIHDAARFVLHGTAASAPALAHDCPLLLAPTLAPAPKTKTTKLSILIDTMQQFVTTLDNQSKPSAPTTSLLVSTRSSHRFHFRTCHHFRFRSLPCIRIRTRSAPGL